MSHAMFRAVTASVPTGYDGSERVIPAGATMVVPLYAASSLATILRDTGKAPARISQIGHYTRPYCGQDLAGKRLLAHRGAGIGDQIVFAGCLAYLAQRYPTARIDLLCDERIWTALWQGSDSLPFAAAHDPIALADWRAYDYHWLAEGLCDGDYEPDQPDIFAGHLQSIGHGDAPAEARLPLVPTSAAWTQRARAFVEALQSGDCSAGRGAVAPADPPGMVAVADSAEYSRVATAPVAGAAQQEYQPSAGPSSSSPSSVSSPPTSRQLILWQLCASATIRSLPPEPTAAALRLLAERRPEIGVIVAGTDDQCAEYAAAVDSPNVIATTRGLRLQEVFALAGIVDGIVCPDSCIGHVSAVFGTPTVSLWCAFPARARAASYRNHRPLEKRGPCSPCWLHHMPDILGEVKTDCPQAESGDPAARWCMGLLAIRPEEIVAKIEEIV